MRKVYHYITCSLLLVAGWAPALAQGVATSTPIQRLKLELVDNRSTFDINEQINAYTNTLRISQPDGDYKLTAGLLKQGDNYITLTRTDNAGTTADVARINLSATKTTPQEAFIDGLDFYGDGSIAPSSSTYINAAALAEMSPNWGTSENGQGLVWQTNGYAYIRATDGLSFTVPSGYSNATLVMNILVGPDVGGGYFAAKVNDGSWSLVATATTGYVSTASFSNINSGDIIYLLGADGSNLDVSPDIGWIEFIYTPDTYIPSITVTPSVSRFDGQNWGADEPMTNVQAATYTPNDVLAMTGLDVQDIFTEGTDANNSRPNYYTYSYSAALDANIMWPENPSTSFSAAADFTDGTIYGTGTWVIHEGADMYYVDDNNTELAGVIDPYGSITFTLPPTYAGNVVDVTVYSCSGTIGARTLYVNGEAHTFTANSSYTWTINTGANGVIEFKSPSDAYSVGISYIFVTGANSASLKARQGDGRKLQLRHATDKRRFINEPLTRSSINESSIIRRKTND